VYAHVPDGEWKKLDQKAVKLQFIGYTETANNYKMRNTSVTFIMMLCSVNLILVRAM